jgi:seryl-tRNA synthetase
MPKTLVITPKIYQQKDGSVKVPEVLQKWVGKEVIEPKK